MGVTYIWMTMSNNNIFGNSWEIVCVCAEYCIWIYYPEQTLGDPGKAEFCHFLKYRMFEKKLSFEMYWVF